MRSAESLRYNLTVPRLPIAVVLLASSMTWAQTPRADLEGAQLGVAAEHLQQGKAEQAIRECKAVLAANPRSAPAHMLLGLAYRAQGSDMIGMAKAELHEALDLDPDLLWARFYLARFYLDQGLSEKAQEELERGLKQSPGAPPFLSLLGEVRRELGDPGASLELNRKALEADANTMTPVHYFLALAYLDLKQEPAAMAEFEKAIHSPDVTPEMYNALASLYIKKQRFAEAEDLCRRAIALDRSQPDAYLNLARIYNAQHASDKALEAVRAALPEGKPVPASGYYQTLQADLAVERGAAYTAKKMYDQAIEQYARALNFDPQRAVIHRRLAQLYLQKGDPARAALHTKEADKLEKGQR